MNRITIIGNSGAGKSTLAIKLAEALDLPVYHMDKIKILSDGIGCTSVPVEAGALLRRNFFQEMPYLAAEDIPPILQMLRKGLGFVLRQDDNFIDLRVDAVTQRKIYEPIDAAEGNRGFGAISRQRHQPFTPPAGHNKGKRVFHLNPLSFC